MNFVDNINTWARDEVFQAKIMIGAGIVLLLVSFFIFRSQNELLRGTLIPVGVLILLLIGYGAVIMKGRPAHAQSSIALYESSKIEALQKEKEKHINDNKTGKLLTKYVYPLLIILSAVLLIFISSLFYKGVALGCIILFVSAYIMDNGFITRSDAFIQYLNSMN